MSESGAPSSDEPLLDALHRAIELSPARPREIEVGIALSIALGRRRPATACGGCSVPLEFEGIPTRTNAHLSVPFLLVFDGPTRS